MGQMTKVLFKHIDLECFYLFEYNKQITHSFKKMTWIKTVKDFAEISQILS